MRKNKQSPTCFVCKKPFAVYFWDGKYFCGKTCHKNYKKQLKNKTGEK